MDLFVVCMSNANDLWPFAFLFSSTASAPRIYSSTTDKSQPRNRFELLQEFVTTLVVVSNPLRRGNGGKMLVLSA